jgi:uncharacterized protein
MSPEEWCGTRLVVIHDSRFVNRLLTQLTYTAMDKHINSLLLTKIFAKSFDNTAANRKHATFHMKAAITSIETTPPVVLLMKS